MIICTVTRHGTKYRTEQNMCLLYLYTVRTVCTFLVYTVDRSVP